MTTDCPICLESVKAFVTLECSHKMCLSCYHQCMNHALDKCSLCRGEIKEMNGTVERIKNLEEAYDNTMEEVDNLDVEMDKLKETVDFLKKKVHYQKNGKCYTWVVI